MNNQNHMSASGAILALLSGAAIGAGLALLYAPQSGRKTRQDLEEWGEEARDYVRQLAGKAERGVEQVKKKGQEWASRGKELAGDAANRAASAAENAQS